MNGQKTCQACGHDLLPSEALFAPGAGSGFFRRSQTDARSKDRILNLNGSFLYVMAGLLVLAVSVSAVGVAARLSSNAYLGMHFILSPYRSPRPS